MESSNVLNRQNIVQSSVVESPHSQVKPIDSSPPVPVGTAKIVNDTSVPCLAELGEQLTDEDLAQLEEMVRQMEEAQQQLEQEATILQSSQHDDKVKQQTDGSHQQTDGSHQQTDGSHQQTAEIQQDNATQANQAEGTALSHETTVINDATAVHHVANDIANHIHMGGPLLIRRAGSTDVAEMSPATRQIIEQKVSKLGQQIHQLTEDSSHLSEKLQADLNPLTDKMKIAEGDMYFIPYVNEKGEHKFTCYQFGSSQSPPPNTLMINGQQHTLGKHVVISSNQINAFNTFFIQAYVRHLLTNYFNQAIPQGQQELTKEERLSNKELHQFISLLLKLLNKYEETQSPMFNITANVQQTDTQATIEEELASIDQNMEKDASRAKKKQTEENTKDTGQALDEKKYIQDQQLKAQQNNNAAIAQQINHTAQDTTARESNIKDVCTAIKVKLPIACAITSCKQELMAALSVFRTILQRVHPIKQHAKVVGK